MISREKTQGALRALNYVLVVARKMAYDGVSGLEIAEVLDVAEYFPRLLADPEDRTDLFRKHLVDLAEKRPDFDLAVHYFDSSDLRPPW